MNVSGTITKSLSGLMNAVGLRWSIVGPCAAGFQDGFWMRPSDSALGIEQAEEFGKRYLAAATGS